MWWWPGQGWGACWGEIGEDDTWRGDGYPDAETALQFLRRAIVKLRRDLDGMLGADRPALSPGRPRKDR